MRVSVVSLPKYFIIPTRIISFQFSHKSYTKMSSQKAVAGPSTYRFNSICILGGNNLGKDESFRHAAYALGKALAARKIHIVYGGDLQGLTGCTAGTALTRGSQILGVSLLDGSKQKTPNLVLGKTLQVSTMQERMGQMLYNSDAFIALPGGVKTLEDILTLISWANCNFHNKPIGFLNVNGFYNGLLSFLEQSMHQEFTPPGLAKILTQASTADELIERLQNIASEFHPSEEVKENKKRKQEVGKNNKDDKRKKKEPDTTLRL